MYLQLWMPSLDLVCPNASYSCVCVQKKKKLMQLLMSLIKTENYVLYLWTIKYDRESKYIAIKTNPEPRTRSELTQISNPPTHTCNDSDLVAFNHR